MNRTPAVLLVAAITLLTATTVHADLTDFTAWTLVEDPADPNMNASATAVGATLVAGPGGVAGGVDIGYQSVNGSTPAASSAGYYFDPASDFNIAIDYDLSFGPTPLGLLGLGFGVGEDEDGMNSAGIAMATANGSAALTFTGFARINDITQPAMPTTVAASLTGSLFVSYNAATGDVTVGATPAPAAIVPTGPVTFSGLQNSWAGGDLLVSFFLRSGDWNSGTGTAVFSNFRVINGTLTAVPEPAVGVVIPLLLAAVRRHRHDRA